MLEFLAATSGPQSVCWNHQHYAAYRNVRGKQRALTIIRGFSCRRVEKTVCWMVLRLYRNRPANSFICGHNSGFHEPKAELRKPSDAVRLSLVAKITVSIQVWFFWGLKTFVVCLFGLLGPQWRSYKRGRGRKSGCQVLLRLHLRLSCTK
jgi:hypothetical protein